MIDRVLVVGCGFVGQAVARRLRARGTHVTGTTTTPDKRDHLATVCDDVVVLRGSDAGAVAAAAAGAGAVVAAAGPAMARSQTPAQRAATYRDVLVATAESVTAAPGAPHLVALSSLSVYGAAAEAGEVDEDAPLTANPDPSPQCFQAAERLYLATGRAAVLRCADVYGPGDPPVEAKIRMVHEHMGGSVPFRPDALFYRVHVDDVAAAVVHAVDQGLTGAFNLTHTERPAANGDVFDGVSRKLGLPPLTYRGEIEAPVVPVSVARLTASGFTCSATEPVRA